jgi:transcriptional regulator with XRE-family HTH domain
MIRKRIVCSSSAGDRVRARRLELGWSQEELARFAGLHRNLVAAIERGRVESSIAEALLGKIGIIPEQPG